MQFIVFWLVVALTGTIITHDYKATWGGIIFLVPTLLLLFTFYWRKKRNKKDSEKNDEKDNVRGKSEEEALEKELESLSDELLLLQQEETRLTTQYNELLQEITADCPKWESKLSEIAEFIPHKKRKS